MGSAAAREGPLSKAELFDRALAIADAEGLEALSMRRLARDAGVEAASLYHHLPNKAALLDGMLVRMRSEMRLPDPLPEDWRELLLSIFLEYRRVLAAHPNLMPLAGRRVETDPDSGLLYLVHLGFGEEEAVGLWQSLLAFTVGFSVFSSAYADSDVSDLPPALAGRMSEWREDTCRKTLDAILRAYDAGRGGRESGGRSFGRAKHRA
jgi:AcrR family transcriptional regulator